MFRFTGIIVVGLLSFSCLAQDNEHPEDSSCKPFEQGREKVASAKQTRFDFDFFKNLEGKKIRHIQFNTINVFDESDPDENNRLYRFVNTLHINTKPKVIKAQLLFKEGEILVGKKVEESERILRQRRYLANAYIVPLTVCDEVVDLLVVTQDSWSLEPQFSLSKHSEGTKSGFALTDSNILGSGNAFLVGYEQNSQRNLIRYEFSNPHLFNSQIDTKLYYADTSDGQNTIVDISHPFYSLITPWSTGIYSEDYTQDDVIRNQDTQINSYEHQSIKKTAFYGWASEVNNNFTRRWLVGLSQEEDIFFANPDTLQDIPSERKAVYPWIEFQYLENRFGVYKNVNQIQRPEDIGLGNNFILRLGYAGRNFDNPDDVVRYLGFYEYTVDISEKGIVETTLSYDGKHHTTKAYDDSGVVGLTGAYHYFQNEKNRWYFGFQYHLGQQLAQYEELTLGDITGMRGFPADFQRGNKRYSITIERRYFTDMHIFNLTRVGAVAFFDAGKAWGVEAYGKSTLLSSAGIGLRFSPTKVRVGNVIHIDFSVPTSSRFGADKYQISVGAYDKF